MKRAVFVCLAVAGLSSPAFAQGKAPETKSADKQPPAQAQGQAQGAPAGGMDMSRMGPWARKPTNEGQIKKEVQAFFKQEEELAKKGDLNAMLERVDFPVFMITDDMSGKPEAKAYTREEYAAMMKPFYENMPKDMKTTHKPTITVLSDSLVNVTDDFTMTLGKTKLTGRNAGLLVKRDGQWRWKSMVEAGWGGDMPGTGGTGSTGTGTSGASGSGSGATTGATGATGGKK